MGRDFIKVLELLMAYVPPEEADLKARFGQVLASAHYTAPEALWSHRGAQVTVLLEDYVAHRFGRDEWADHVRDIWAGKGAK